MRKFNPSSNFRNSRNSRCGVGICKTAPAGCRPCGRQEMGKRSNFERREADFYPTPRAAVVPLIPYLRGIRSFAEPCAGDGALVRHLESFGLRCVYSRRHSPRSGCACTRRLRRGRRDHHEPALVARPDAQADRALPEHRADVAAAGCGLGTHQAGGAVPAPLLGHRGNRPREMDRGFQAHRQGQLRVVQVRYQAQGRPVFHGRDNVIPIREPESASNAARLMSHSDPVRGSVRRRAGSAPIASRLSVTSSVTGAPSDPRRCSAMSDTPTFRGSRRKAGSCCLHSMAHTTASTRC